ncbi:MAG: TPM domain-containing protein [Phenylobacterium sp.]
MTAGARARLRRGGGLLAAVLAAFAFATVAFAATPKFPAMSGRVVDNAHILSPDTQQKLTDELAGLEQQTGHQLVVVTVPDLQGFEIEDFGYQLGRAWLLGRKGVNDGAIFLVAPKEHKVRIEVGYGLEPVLTDALTNVILTQKVLPQFKAGHMEAGVIAGTEALVSQLGLPDDQAKANVAQAQVSAATHERDTSARGDRGGGGFPVILALFIVFWVLSALLRGRRGGGGLWWLPLMFLSGGRGGGWGDRDGGGGFGGGGFSGGGGGGFGGGGSSGSW